MHMSCDSSGRNPSVHQNTLRHLTFTMKPLQILCLILCQTLASLPLNCWKAAQLFLEVPRQNLDGSLRSGSHGCQQLRKVMLKSRSYCSVQWIYDMCKVLHLNLCLKHGTTITETNLAQTLHCILQIREFPRNTEVPGEWSVMGKIATCPGRRA